MYKLPEKIDQLFFIETMKKICLEASSLLRSYTQNIKCQEEYEKKLKIEYKDNAPVTAADLQVNELIVNGIRKGFPDAKWEFLSEESYKNFEEKYFYSDWLWIIDPLDGTKDFIQKTGEYAIHLALTFCRKPIFSVVVIPDLEEFWFYFEGIGTWCEDTQNNKKRYSGLVEKKLEDFTILTSKSHRHQDLNLLLEKLNVAEILGMGSVGNKITKIIKGEADLYISYSLEGGSSPKDWDMAAPEAIIRGSGGFLTNIDGSELAFLKDKNISQDGIIIGSKNVQHKKICEIISKELLN